MKARTKNEPSALEAAERIHSAAIRLLRTARRQDSKAELSPARLSALSVLVFRGSLSLKALAAAEEVKPPTMSKIVDGLARARLARRRESRTDGRAWEIEATAKGRAVLSRARKRRVAYLARLFSSISVEERSMLEDAADIIERSMKAARRTEIRGGTANHG